MHLNTFEYFTFREPTKVAGDRMHAVARKSLRAIFKLHPRDVRGEILFKALRGCVDASSIINHAAF
jgi:hypothetical protein